MENQATIIFKILMRNSEIQLYQDLIDRLKISASQLDRQYLRKMESVVYNSKAISERENVMQLKKSKKYAYYTIQEENIDFKKDSFNIEDIISEKESEEYIKISDFKSFNEIADHCNNQLLELKSFIKNEIVYLEGIKDEIYKERLNLEKELIESELSNNGDKNIGQSHNSISNEPTTDNTKKQNLDTSQATTTTSNKKFCLLDIPKFRPPESSELKDKCGIIAKKIGLKKGITMFKGDDIFLSDAEFVLNILATAHKIDSTKGSVRTTLTTLKYCKKRG